MPASRAQIEANRRNAARSTGPKTPEGKAVSRGNATTHGQTGRGLSLPEVISRRAEQLRAELTAEHRPADAFAVALVEMVAVTLARLEPFEPLERSYAVAFVERASCRWDLEREAEAAALGDRLRKAPARVAAELRRSAAGCHWLLDRWVGLGTILQQPGGWTDSHRLLAGDLLGLDPDLRSADPRLSADAPLEVLAALVADQLAGLRRRLETGLDSLDDRDRQRAIAGLSFVDSPEARRLSRYDSANYRRLTWALAELRRRSASPSSSEPTAPLSPRPPAPSPPPCPADSDPADTPEATADSDPDSEANAPSPPPSSSSRPPLPQNRRARRAAAARARAQSRHHPG